jgi:hypothetical protein
MYGNGRRIAVRQLDLLDQGGLARGHRRYRMAGGIRATIHPACIHPQNLLVRILGSLVPFRGRIPPAPSRTLVRLMWGLVGNQDGHAARPTHHRGGTVWQCRFQPVGRGVVGARKTDPRRRQRASATLPAGSGTRQMLPFSRKKGIDCSGSSLSSQQRVWWPGRRHLI